MKTLEERKESQRVATRKWTAANREKHRAAVKLCRNRPEAKETHRKRQLRYAAKHREQERLRVAQWRKDNPELSRRLDRSKYLKNKTAVLEYNRKYREDNPERASLWQRNRQSKKRANGGGTITIAFVRSLRVAQNDECVTCKANLTEVGYQIDHIVPISKGGAHSELNIMLLCPTCNKRKSARSLAEFLAILEVENA